MSRQVLIYAHVLEFLFSPLREDFSHQMSVLVSLVIIDITLNRIRAKIYHRFVDSLPP